MEDRGSFSSEDYQRRQEESARRTVGRAAGQRRLHVDEPAVEAAAGAEVGQSLRARLALGQQQAVLGGFLPDARAVTHRGMEVVTSKVRMRGT